MSRRTAILDACVLYPAQLRSLLIYVARTGIYRARWTDDIHDEWIRNLRQNNPKIRADAIQRTRRLMDESLADCLVTEYEKLIPSLHLPDQDDRHVLAAAIASHADTIVTFNITDFPASTLDAFGIEAIDPDEFLVGLLQEFPETFCAATRQQRASLKNPAMSVSTFLSSLEQARLPRTVNELRTLTDSL